jgi:Uma2 family endonuclease
MRSGTLFLMGATDTVTLTRHKLSVEDYHAMGKAGILNEDSRVELIEGELIDMSPIGSRHASVVNTLSKLCVEQADRLAIVSIQNSLSLPPDSEPQPDIMLLKARPDRYWNALPTGSDVLLLIEVADTTLGYDRNVKLPLYARHDIPEVWLIDLQTKAVELYSDPAPHGYRKILRPDADTTISPVLVPAVQLPLRELWGAGDVK